MLGLHDANDCLGCQGRINRLRFIALIGEVSSFPAGGHVCLDHPSGPLKGAPDRNWCESSRFDNRDMNAERLKFGMERLKSSDRSNT
jgi:hypothetical protein